MPLQHDKQGVRHGRAGLLQARLLELDCPAPFPLQQLWRCTCCGAWRLSQELRLWQAAAVTVSEVLQCKGLQCC